MDIHKPKPWHDFREFLKEYLIIVVGVLTALAAEQVIVAADKAGFRIRRSDLDQRLTAVNPFTRRRGCFYLSPVPLDPR